MNNIETDITLGAWLSELDKLKIPAYDPYGFPGTMSNSLEKQIAAQKAADKGLWREYKARGWSLSRGTTLVPIMLVYNGKEIGIFPREAGTVIKFSSPSKKAVKVIEQLICLVRGGIKEVSLLDKEWKDKYLDRFRYYDEKNFSNPEFISGIQRLIDTRELWQDNKVKDLFKSQAYRLIMEGKCSYSDFPKD